MLFCIRCKTLIGYLQNVVRILAKREISLCPPPKRYLASHTNTLMEDTLDGILDGAPRLLISDALDHYRILIFVSGLMWLLFTIVND